MQKVKFRTSIVTGPAGATYEEGLEYEVHESLANEWARVGYVEIPEVPAAVEAPRSEKAARPIRAGRQERSA